MHQSEDQAVSCEHWVKPGWPCRECLADARALIAELRAALVRARDLLTPRMLSAVSSQERGHVPRIDALLERTKSYAEAAPTSSETDRPR